MKVPPNIFTGVAMKDPFPGRGSPTPVFLFSGHTMDPQREPYCELFMICDTPSLTGKRLARDISEAGGLLTVILGPGEEDDIGSIRYNPKSGGNATGKRTEASGTVFRDNLKPISADESRRTAIPHPSQLPAIPSP